MKILFKWALRLSAILIPVYIIYYPGLYEQPNPPEMVVINRLVWMGFMLYLIGGSLYFFLT